MKMRKKAIGLVVLSAAVLSAIIIPSMAIFSDKANKEISIKATNLEVAVSEIDTSQANLDKFNPGDGDPSNPEGARPGMPHDFSFTVNSTGNTAVMARNVVSFSVRNKDDDTSLDPTKFFLLNDDGEKVADEFLYLSDNGTAYKPKAEFVGTPTHLKYILPAYELSGTGEGADVIEGHPETNKAFAYKIGLSRTVDEDFEMAALSAKVEIESIQYRNSKQEDFQSIFKTLGE